MPVPTSLLALLHDRSPATRIVVVGASNDRGKYGWQIVQNLRAKGYTVLPVNPREARIGELTCYPAVSAIPGRVDIANFVVPPDVSLDVLRALDPAQVRHVWFQPGSYDRAVLLEAERRWRNVVAEDCIMVVAAWA
jgi:predicted CoA-binding protein